MPHGRLLVRFAEAVLGSDAAELARVQAEMIAKLGPAGLVDAAAVAGLFNAIDRVADATGIPLDDDRVGETADFRAQLGIAKYAG